MSPQPFLYATAHGHRLGVENRECDKLVPLGVHGTSSADRSCLDETRVLASSTVDMRFGCKEEGHKRKKELRKWVKKESRAHSGNRTRDKCLEGAYDNHFTKCAEGVRMLTFLCYR